MHALNNSLIHYVHLYQDNIEANGIFKNKIEGKLRKMPRNLSEQNLFGFHRFIMSCDDLSACTSYGHTVHTLVGFPRLRQQTAEYQNLHVLIRI